MRYALTRAGRLSGMPEDSLVAAFLTQFHLLPQVADFLGVAGSLVAIYVRVTEYEFVAQPITYIGYVEIPRFAGYLGVEDDVQEHVAKFLAYLIHVMTHDGGGEFVGLFDGVLTQTLESLFAVPRAFLAEFVHDGQQAVKCR